MTAHVSLDLLHTFLAVYRAGTLTSAAQVLGLSQPTVTAQLRALEQQIGQQLFVRRARGVVPTASGDDLARRLDGMLDAVVGVAAGLGRPSPAVGRTLHLGGPAELLSARVLPALAGPIGAGWDVRVQLGLAGDLLGDLAAGRLDLVVSTVRPRLGGVSAQLLYDEEFLLVATPAVVDGIDPDLLAREPARALRAVPVLAYAEDLPIVRRWWRHVLAVAPPKRAVLVVADLRALRAAAKAGVGMTVLPRYLVGDDLAAGRLVEVHPTDDPPINTLYLAGRTAAHDDTHLTAVRAVLLRHARDW